MNATADNFEFKRRFVRLSMVVIVLGILLDRVEFVETNSIPFRFGFQAFGTPGLGDYARVPVRNKLIEDGEASTLTKRIACAAGDKLTFDGEAHYCNGVKVDTINVRALDDGTRMPIFEFNGVVPAGKLYLLGTHPRSFDSRYLGFFDASTAIKVWGIF